MQHGTVSSYTNKNCRCEKCTKAMRDYVRQFRKKRPDVRAKLKQGNERLRLAKRDFIRSKKDRPCEDCKKSYPFFVMTFDHCSGEKTFNISEYARKGWQQIIQELKKCEAVCANCQAIRTHKRLTEKPKLIS